jgi:hypothetical protein
MMSLLTYTWLGVAMAVITLPLLIIGSYGVLSIRVRWHSFSLSILQGEKALWERHGFGMIAERRINMSMVGSTEFQQTLLGRILDYGSLSIGALGGPYQWENLGHFRTLRRIIESQGEWTPQSRISLANIMVGFVHRVIRLLNRFLHNFRLFVNSLEFEMRIIVGHLQVPSYRRFLKFAEKILFFQTDGLDDWLQMESLHDSAFSREEIRIYKSILRDRRLIASDIRGKAQRHQRIQKPEDIRKYVPATWFLRAIRTAGHITL